MNTSTNSSPVLDPAEGVYGSRRVSIPVIVLIAIVYFGLQLIRGWVS